MKRGVWLLLLASILVPVRAQDRADVLARARGHIDTLAGEAMHGRGYVQGGDSLAAEYIARHFAKIGLRPVRQSYFQHFTFNVNSFPDSVKLQVDGRPLRPGIDFLVHPASGSAEGRFDLVHVTAEDLLDPGQRAMTMGVITGKAVCLHLPATTDPDSLHLFAALEQDLMHHGPVVRPVQGKLTWSVAREALPYPLLEMDPALLPDTARAIDLRVRNHLRVRHQARNVLGMVPGRGKGWVVVAAHYDHLGRMGPDVLFPGANDNASGVAMLLALAEHFAGKRARHNMLFVAFAGEEAGLVGSEWFVADRSIDLGEIRLMLNLDILGTGDEGITVVNATAEKAAFDRLVALNMENDLLPQVKARGPACNSDHCPFVKRGIPGVFMYTLGGVAHYHDVNDRAETLPLTRFAELFELLGRFIATIE